MKAKTLLIFTINDIAHNIRYLRFIKSFLEGENNNVITFGSIDSPNPCELEQNSHFTSIDSGKLFKFRSYIHFLFFPFKILFDLFIFVRIIYSLPSIDYILTSTNNIFICFFAWVLAKCKHSKLIFDISSKILFNHFYLHLADIRIAPTRQIGNQIFSFHLPVLTIHSPPGLLFQNNSSNRPQILSKFDFPAADFYIGIPLYFFDQNYSLYFQQCIKLLSKCPKNILLIVFVPKSMLSQIIQDCSHFSPGVDNSHFKLLFETMNPSTYPYLLGACDFGIALEQDNDKNIGKVKRDLYYCNVPMIAYETSFANELIRTESQSQTGYLFNDIKSFEITLEQVIQNKSVPISILQENCFKYNISYEKEIQNFFHYLLRL